MIWTFIKAHWRPVAVLAALLVAFATGRYTTQGPKVINTESIRFVEKKVEVVKVEKAKDRIVYRNIITRPDGTREDHSVIKTETDTKSSTDIKIDSGKTTETRVEVEPYKPQWRVGALLGVNAGALIHGPSELSWNLLAAGAFAERRIAGPVWIGIWGLSVGPAFGVTVGVEF